MIRVRRTKAATDSTKTDGFQASSSSSDPIPALSLDAFAAQPKERRQGTLQFQDLQLPQQVQSRES